MSWSLTSQGLKELSVLNSDITGLVGDSLFLDGTDLCLGLSQIYTTCSEADGLVSS